MKVRRDRFTATAATAAAALFLAGCGAANAGSPAIGGVAATGAPITIGISLPLTKDFAADGQAFQAGYQLWADQVNSSGGLLGRPVQLIIKDNQSDPGITTTQYTDFVNQHVDLTFGPFSSLLTKPAETAVAQAGYAMIEGAGNAETVYNIAANKQHHNLFSPSLPVQAYLVAFDNWVIKHPPASAAFVTVDDPFATPAVQFSYHDLTTKVHIKTTYPPAPFDETSNQKINQAATQVAQEHPDMVVLGCTAVPTLAAFIGVFKKNHYTPKIFIATSGPDQGAAFINSPGVGYGNANAIMVPGGWNGTYQNADSYQMVERYIAKYGGNAAGVNADVAEAYSVGEVAADAIIATGGVDNTKIINWLRQQSTPAKAMMTVQGPVYFDNLGRNKSSADFIFQWQGTSFVQVLSNPPGPQQASIVSVKPPMS